MYTLVRETEKMTIVVISAREDSTCYVIAETRKDKYGNKLNEEND